MNCKCEAPLIQEGNVQICTECGVQQTILENEDRHESYEDVYVCVYSRRKRFECLFDAVVYPHFQKKDTRIFKQIQNKVFKTTSELMDFVRTLPDSDKRFCSIHLFAKYTLENYKPPVVPPLEFKARVMSIFDEILARYTATCNQKTFFSYPWLLNCIMKSLGKHEYCKFIKPIRCHRRCKKYIRLMKSLCTGDMTGYTFHNYVYPT